MYYDKMSVFRNVLSIYDKMPVLSGVICIYNNMSAFSGVLCIYDNMSFCSGNIWIYDNMSAFVEIYVFMSALSGAVFCRGLPGTGGCHSVDGLLLLHYAGDLPDPVQERLYL